jgi:RNA polymerase sigma factor (sigma-70 family)
MQKNDSTNFSKLIDHLFRREAGRITSVLTRIFGIGNIELVEDVVQDVLIKAFQQWPYSGIPENPSAWLYKAAKNRAIDILRKEKLKEKYTAEISTLFKSEWTLSSKVTEFFSENEIKDGQLRMMFACCHPGLPGEAQVALALKHLCGFSTREIARAFLTNEEAITKRLGRAKNKLKEGIVKFEIPAGANLKLRLENVLSSLYLLFNEGYNSSNADVLIRDDLIEEAIRLTSLLIDHPQTSKPEVHALLSLMLFHYARTPARIDNRGNILLLKEQDRKLWNKNLITEAEKHLALAASGNNLTEYHLEAGIASLYTTAESFENTDWEKILYLYDILYKMNLSPIIGLNRAIVVAHIKGAEQAIKEIKLLPRSEMIQEYYLYHSALGELYLQNGQPKIAAEHLKTALSLTSSEAERKFLKKKIEMVKI